MAILYISFRRNKSDNEELNQSVITTALVFNTEDYITLRSNLSKIETMSDKQEIVEISEKIDAYETSILPFEDCCTIFVAKHPVTKPSLNVIHNDEKKLSEKIDELMQKAIDTVEVIHIEA